MSETENLLVSVREIVGGLKRTTEGSMLHGLIERGLRKFETTPMVPAFIAFTTKLLERYLTNPDSDPATRIRVKVIQQRLKLYLDVSPQDEIVATPDTAAPAVSAPVTVAPLPVAGPIPTPVVTPPQPEPTRATPPAETQAQDVTPRPEVIEPAAAGSESLPEQLAREMTESLSDSDELDELLHKSLASIGVNGASSDLTALKRELVRGIEELLSEHRQLEQHLSSARTELQAMDSDRRHLEQALTKAREQSLTDELTGLPNRQAFLRQLNAEIGRARRYGFSLALALIDVDNLHAVNQRFGQAAGDAVLHAYAREIMSQFRGYDLVARYGGDEFAVLLPNTQREGATQAVDKAQKRAADTFIQVDGHTIPLPSFSSVLTLYAHGEPPAALLQRADEALLHAKQRGRAQAVVALPPAG